MSVSAMATEVSISDAVPTTVGNTPGLTANTNPLNTPPATGQITVAHSPSGAVVTNTGRSTSAHQTYVANLHPLKGWNGVRTPGNTP